MADLKVSNMTAASTLSLNDLLMIVQLISGENNSMKVTLAQLASEIVNGIEYTSDLDTTSKKIIGAINEVRGTFVTGTLTAGSTSLTLSDASITTSSTIDIYVSTFGIQPVNAVVTTGSITLSFLAQASDLSVKVRVS